MDTGTARKWNPEPRRGPGRRYADGREDPAVRGLLHDLGHEATTLAYLVEAVRGEPGFPSAARVRLELVSLEVSRLLDIIFHGVPDDHGYDETDIVDVRALAGQVAVLASARHRTSVVLRPGPAMSIQVNSVLLWRVLSNVIGNAARAASAPPQQPYQPQQTHHSHQALDSQQIRRSQQARHPRPERRARRVRGGVSRLR